MQANDALGIKTVSDTFSATSRADALRRFKAETFDFLIIGGGITGACVARDAAMRGLKVALVEREDFAYGTSSRSSKLIHGGLRYLENFEIGLVFEALSERAMLLRTVPNMVRPLPFYFPVYKGDAHGKFMMGAGLWLYDLLALFRAPGFHRSLSRDRFLAEIPFLKKEGLQGGFRYYDASMWDDVLAVEVLRSAQAQGAVVANYTEATNADWDNNRIRGFGLKDRESGEEFRIRAKRTIVCAGPWTDEVGAKLSPNWRRWLNPSKGVHLIFDLKRLPVPGAMVMNHPQDGRIAFVIPRPDFGAGVVIVGTTDGPTPTDPNQAGIEAADVRYIMELLNRYFPDLKLNDSDILSAYVGVRPLMGAASTVSGSEMQSVTERAEDLRKVSREHYIGAGPGGTILVAGGKYTTARRMAQEIIDHALEAWRKDHAAAGDPPRTQRAPTETPINPAATDEARARFELHARNHHIEVPRELLERYGAEAEHILQIQAELEAAGRLSGFPAEDPAGFPHLGAQLIHAMRAGMAIHLQDFYLRRMPLFASRADHGQPWAEALSVLWAQERGLSSDDATKEAKDLLAELERREAWRKQL